MTQIRKRGGVPKFNLKDLKSKNPTLIYLMYNYKYDQDGKLIRLKYSTKEKVIPKYWDGPSQQVKNSLYVMDWQEINHRLYSLKSFVRKVVDAEPNIDLEVLRSRLDSYNHKGNVPQVPTLIEYVEKYIQQSDKESRTIQKYRGVLAHLKEYSKEKQLTLRFEDVTLDFKKDFLKWLYGTSVSSQNTASKIIGTLKQFMTEAAQQTIVIAGEIKPYHVNRGHLHKDFNVSRVLTTKHFLELSELDLLCKYDLSKNPTFELVRDLFLVSCYTGLRISDIETLSKDHFSNDGENEVITIHTYKGRNSKADNQVVIPVFPQLRKILLKYDYILPECISHQKHNDYIKSILKLAEIDRTVIDKQSENGKMVEKSIPIYKKISNHSGRYTFINFMMNDYNVSPEKLMKITGQSLKVLMGYERGNKKKNAVSVLKSLNTDLTVIKNIG